MDNNNQGQAGAPNNEEQPQGYQFGDYLLRPAADACTRWADTQVPQPDAPYQFGDFFLRPAAAATARGISAVLNQTANAGAAAVDASIAAGNAALSETARQATLVGAEIGAQIVQNGADRARGIVGDRPASAALSAAQNVPAQINAAQAPPQPYRFGDVTRNLLWGAQAAVTAGANAAIGQEQPAPVNNNAPR